jgi:aryl-alcohol dehydrogenase-like predicted oxidoreductase
METRALGTSDLHVPVLGLGCNNFGYSLDQHQADAVVDACFEEGVVFFDTADYYGESELILGAALAGRRDGATVATKFGNDLKGRLDTGTMPRGSRAYIRAAVEASLRRLGTEVIDLYQQHVPDPTTPIEETMHALTELRQEGKIRAFGCSNLSAPTLVTSLHRAEQLGLDRWSSSQNRYNLLERDVEAALIPACMAEGIGLIAYFPLANGLLTGKYRRDAPAPAGARLTEQKVPWRTRAPAGLDLLSEETFARLDPLTEFAASRGVTLLEVALGGIAAEPVVSCMIAGATRPEQVRANAAAVAWRPAPEDIADLDRASGRVSTRGD